VALLDVSPHFILVSFLDDDFLDFLENFASIHTAIAPS